MPCCSGRRLASASAARSARSVRTARARVLSLPPPAAAAAGRLEVSSCSSETSVARATGCSSEYRRWMSGTAAESTCEVCKLTG